MCLMRDGAYLFGVEPLSLKIPQKENGSGDRARTCNILVNSQALYH